MLSTKLAELLTFVNTAERVCPKPSEWYNLWNILLKKEQIGSEWTPPLPLIWREWIMSSVNSKRGRLKKQNWCPR